MNIALVALGDGVVLGPKEEQLRALLDPAQDPEQAIRSFVSAAGAERGVRFLLVEEMLADAVRALGQLRDALASKKPCPCVEILVRSSSAQREERDVGGLHVVDTCVVRVSGLQIEGDPVGPVLGFPPGFDINAQIRSGALVATITDGEHHVPMRFDGEVLVSDPWPHGPATVWLHVGTVDGVDALDFSLRG